MTLVFHEMVIQKISKAIKIVQRLIAENVFRVVICPLL